MAKNFTFKETNERGLFRVIDQKGNWDFYYHEKTKKYLRSVNSILSNGYPKGKFFEEYLKAHSKEEVEARLQEACEKGDMVHEFIRYLFNNGGKANRQTRIFNRETNKKERLTDEQWRCIPAFQSFWLKHKPVLIASEIAGYNNMFGYAGTLDAILILTAECDLKNCPCHGNAGKIGVWDWKSGASIWDSYGPQLASYSKFENISEIMRSAMKKILMARGIKVRNYHDRAIFIPVVEYTGVLRIGTNHKTTNGYEAIIYDKIETADHWSEFLAAKTIVRGTCKPFDEAKDIKEIETKIDLKMPQKKKRNNTKIDPTISRLGKDVNAIKGKTVKAKFLGNGKIKVGKVITKKSKK